MDGFFRGSNLLRMVAMVGTIYFYRINLISAFYWHCSDITRLANNQFSIVFFLTLLKCLLNSSMLCHSLEGDPLFTFSATYLSPDYLTRLGNFHAKRNNIRC